MTTALFTRTGAALTTDGRTAADGQPRYEQGVNSGTLLEEGTTNILAFPNDFSNAIWTKIIGGVGSTPVVTSGFVGPDDVQKNAWRAQLNKNANGASDYSIIMQTTSVLINGTTFSIYMKSNTGANQNVMLRISAAVSPIVVVVTPIWTRFSISNPASSPINNWVQFGGLTTYGDTTLDILVCNAQMEIKPSATAFVSGTRLPRYSKGTHGSAIMIEEATTNLITSPTDYGTGWLLTGVTAPTSSVPGPLGPNVTANKLSETAVTSTHMGYFDITKAASALPYSFTFYVKSAERTNINVELAGSTGYYGFNINLATLAVTGVVTSGFTSGSYTITNVANSWIKIVITATTNTTTKIYPSIRMINGTTTYLGTLGSGVYLYTSQLEQKASPTTFITGTRNVESLRVPRSVMNSSEGTISFWFNLRGGLNGAPRLFEWGAYSVATPASPSIFDWFAIYRASATIMRFTCRPIGATAEFYATSAATTLTLGTWYHIAVTWKLGETLKLYINTVLAESPTPLAVIPAFTGSSIYDYPDVGQSGAGADNCNGIIDNLQILNKAWTADQVIAEYRRAL